MQTIADKPRLTTRPETGAARIFMPTWRDFTRRAFQCGLYEAQDVLAETDHAELVHVEASSNFRAKETLQRRLLYHDFTKRLVYKNPGLLPVRLTQNYDAFIAVCQSHPDFLYVNAIEGWRDRCKTSICWIDELWVARIPLYKHWLHALRRFDYVFTGSCGSVTALSEAIGKKVYWLPNAVDAIRFSPYPRGPERAIDVYSIGRRFAGVHGKLVQMADRGEIFYVYDTARGADSDTMDAREHRTLFANMAKRSRYFMVGAGKLDDFAETRGQIEFGPRYYEGSAAGAVLLGQAPKQLPAFQEMCGWPDSVIEVNPDGSDVAEVMANLDANPERWQQISRRNTAEALRRHDWIYRWKEMFRVAGIPLSEGMLEREKRLQELAAMADRIASS